jgi:acetyl-CoA carboxylase/biotin carboxylase 1
MAEVNGNGVKPHTNGTVPVTNNSSSYAAKFQLADHFIGGNKLENAPASAVKDFVASHDGHTVITNVRINPSIGNLSGRAIADVSH